MRLILFIIIISKILNDCDTYDNKYGCIYGQDHYSEEWDNFCFQTPPRNDIFHNYKESYQDMHYLVGYAQLIYSKNKKQCTINFITKVNPELGIEGIDYKIIYKFGDKMRLINSYTLTSNDSYPKGFSLSAIILHNDNKQMAKLELENIFFLWDNIKINQDNKYENGQKGVIVELFGWPYDDIKEECEFLGNSGYLGVKISPPNEAILTYDIEEQGELNPWWYFLQPVSYKLESRLGNKIQLKHMINECRSNNIRIYSQIVINHMTGNGNDMYEIHKNGNCSLWGAKTGSGGSPFWTTKGRYENNLYTGNIPVIEFPSVPYFASDFHCFLNFNDNRNTYELNYHWIGDLIDLNTEKEYVQQRISDFITDLISLGISGISIVNARHISPNNYASIFNKLKNNLGGSELPDDFIAILELSYQDNKDIMLCDDNYSFGEPFTKKLKDRGFNDKDIKKIKIGNEEPDALPVYEDIWKINQERHAMSFENYDIQKSNIYNDFSYIITKNIDIHRDKTISMIKNNNINWKIKIIFSSYSLINGACGFPDGKSDCSKCNTVECVKFCKKTVPISKAYDPLSRGYDAGNINNWKEGTYTRIHRDITIINSMREWMELNLLNNDELYFIEEINAYNCSDKRPFINLKSGLCSKECSVADFFNEKCKIKNEESQIAKDILIKNIENEIMDGSINDLLLNAIIEEKEDLIIETNNTLYQITSSYNQNNKIYSNISSVNLGKCEEILKKEYNINDNETLIILKVETYQEGILFPIIQYEIFHPITKAKLNLDYCNNTKITILIPKTINEDDLYKYNISSDYYTNKCYPFTSENSTDITLEDRANEYISNNLSLCEGSCEYNGYDINYKKVICDCEVKEQLETLISEYSIDKEKLRNSFVNVKDYLNLKVFKCYYILFTKDGFTKNSGNFILLSIIIIYFISRNFFYIKGFDLFKLQILKLLYLKKDNENDDNYNSLSIYKSRNKRLLNDSDSKTDNEKINCKNRNISLNDNIINENINENNDINFNTCKNIEEINNNIDINKEIKDYRKLYKEIEPNIVKDRKNNILKTCKTSIGTTNYNINFPTKKSKIKLKIKKKKNLNFKNKLALNNISSNNLSNNNILIYSKSNSNNSIINKINNNNILLNKENINNNNCNDVGTVVDENNFYNDYELNNLSYKLALEIDKRTYLQHYCSLLRMKHLLIFTFYNFNDYNSITIKICLLLFTFSLNLTVNALFFTDSTMHKIYEDKGKFNFIYLLPKVIFSTIITYIINYLIKYISLSQRDILLFKKENNVNNKENLVPKLEALFKCLIIKFTLFFDISILFLILFWYYLSCFCAVYRNTQRHLIKDTFISFGFSLLYQFIINFIPGILRIQALKDQNKKMECIYKISKYVQLL